MQSDGYLGLTAMANGEALVCYDRMGINQGPCVGGLFHTRWFGEVVRRGGARHSARLWLNDDGGHLVPSSQVPE
jgi:hypothetical protein